MGKDKKTQGLSNTANTAGQQYQNLYSSQTPLEESLKSQSQGMTNNYNQSVGRQTQDYSNIMGGYQDFAKNMAAPRTFSASGVGVTRPEELNKAYGYLNEAAPGYRTFAETGGYSPQDIQELRARGSAPITAAYSNAEREINRTRAIGGAGGSPNYIAAMSRMQRELPGQLASATTNVNAGLADAIRQGKLSGLSGLTGIGGQMGGLASAESGRQLQAGIANQGADLQAQGMTQGALNNYNQAQLGALGGQTGLYGTTPAMAATFGNQALNASGQWLNAEQMRNQQGQGLLNTQNQSYSGMPTQQPWWKQVLGAAGSVMPYLGGFVDGGGFGGGGGFGNEGDFNSPYFQGMPPGGYQVPNDPNLGGGWG